MSLHEFLNRKTKNDITNLVGLVVVPSGTILDRESIELLEQHRIDFVDVLLSVEQKSEPVPLAVSELQGATHLVKDLFSQIKSDGQVAMQTIKTELMPIIQKASEQPDLFQLFESMKSKDEYTYQHNIGVGVLSTLIGKWLQFSEEDIAVLSLAATLHDIGKVRFSQELLLKPDKLTPEEFDQLKLHTIYGYEILKNMPGLHPRIPLVALQHHERMDGSGYPQRLANDQIDRMSRIVAIADVYYSMSSKRPYREAFPFYEVVDRMRAGYFGELDPTIVGVFLRNLIHNLIGQKVLLTDGRWGEVIYINPHDDTHPLVKVDDVFIDLSKDRMIHIQEIVF